MWRRISSRRLLAVIGPSGVGKSSFLRAGVIAAAPPGWRTLICTPGEAPFMGLARALVPELAGDAEQVELLLAFDDPEVALEVMTRWRQRSDEALLVVDQLEELFTLNPPEIRKRFVDLLVRLAAVAGIHVVLVLRDDFLHECHAHPPLEPILRDLTLLGPPAAGDLRRALVEPARRRGFRFDDDELPEEMVASVAKERGALPLLAFAARRLWELRDRERRLITRESYEKIGGVAGALAQHAEATLEAIGSERMPLVRELFRNLVTAQQTRSARSVDDLLSVFDENQRDAADQVLQTLIGARLLTSFEEESTEESEAEGPRRVEVVHESLLREWPRLVRWQTQDADSARLRDQLRQAAQLWHARGRPDELLWAGTPYLEFKVWRESYPGGLTATEQAFADAMAGHARRRTQRRRLVTAAVLLAAVAVAAVTTALWRRSELQSRRLEARRLAEIARQTMEGSPPRALACAVASLEIVDSPDVRRLALEALWSSPMPLVIPAQPPQLAIGVDFSPDGRWLVTSHFDGHLGLWRESGDPPVLWRAHQDRTRAFFTPDPGALISGSGVDPELSVWSVPEARLLGTQAVSNWTSRTDIDPRLLNLWQRLRRWIPNPAAPGGWVIDDSAMRLCERLAGGRLRAGALSPDGSQVVFAVGEALYLAPVAEPSTPTLLGRAPSAVEIVEFHADGDRLATAHADGTLRLWSFHHGIAEPLRDWPRDLDGFCYDLGFDLSGALLVAAFDDGRAVVRAVAEPPGADPLLLSPPLRRRMNQLAFHPGGRWLATASLGGACLWPLDSARHPTVLRGHSGPVDQLAFAPDGSWLASIGVDGTVRRWPLGFTRGALPSVLDDWGHTFETATASIAISPDGRYVVATGSESSARVVPVDGSPPQTLGGFDQRVLSAAVGPGGRLVAVPGRIAGRMVVRVWDLETGAVSDLDLGDPRDWLAFRIAVGFDGDGRLLVAHQGRLMRVDPATGGRATLAEDVGRLFASGRQDTVVLSCRPDESRPATVHDLVAGTDTPLPRHGRGVNRVALDPGGTVAVTGSWDGVVRVGPVTGEEPHWLVGHEGSVKTVAVSPDGRLIASGGSDGTIRLWPMPDLSKPPLHALPRAELLARLKSLTNLRVVRNPDDPENYLVRAEPFPGWHTIPEW